MKLAVSQEVLARALKAAVSVIHPQAPNPMLRNLKIEASEKKDGQIILSATQYETSVIYTIPAKVKEEGVTAVFGDRLMNIVSELPEGDVSITANDAECIVKAKKCRLKLPVYDPEEFPTFTDKFAKAHSFSIPIETFATLFNRCGFARAKDYTRNTGPGVLLWSRKKQAFMVACSESRLCEARAKADVGLIVADEMKGLGSSEGQVVMPHGAIKTLLSMLPDEGKLEVGLQKDSICFRHTHEGERLFFISRMLSRAFPNYIKVFDHVRDHPYEAKIPVAAWMTSLRLAMHVTSEESRGVEHKFSKGKLGLRSQAAARGEAVLDLPIEYDGPEVTMVVDPDHLLDGLKASKLEEVQVKFNGSDDPVLIHDKGLANNRKTDDGFVYFIAVIEPGRQEEGSEGQEE